MARYTVAVLGSGNVGSTLGAKWAKAGHKVIFTSREANSEKMRNLVESVPGSTAASHDDGLNAADVRQITPIALS